MINVALWDRHPVTRAGLRQLIYEHVDLRVACEADAEPQALDMLVNHEIDILLLDLPQSVHPGIDALSSIRRAAPGLRVLVFTSYSVQHGAVASFRAGARGYLNKSCESHEIVEAIRTIALGNRFFSGEVTDVLARQLNQDSERATHELLSGRELQVFYELAKGQTASSIATTLALSVKTVSTYRTRTLEKLSLSSNSDLTHYAVNHRLIV
jgi:two-component system invasion response regulator UvrY